MSHRRLVVAFVSAFCAATFASSPRRAPGRAPPTRSPPPREIGVTPTEIAHRGDRRRRHTARARAPTPAPRDAVQASAKYINEQGGLAGRKVVVDFYDSKLNGDETRNAIIKACQNDFAIVGTGALFLNNVDDMVGVPRRKGAKTGLPDVPVVTLWEAQQNSPVSFPITAPAKVFTDPSGADLPGAGRPLPLVPPARVEGSARHLPRGCRPRGAEDRDHADLARRAEGRDQERRRVRRPRRRRPGQVPPDGHRDAVRTARPSSRARSTTPRRPTCSRKRRCRA